MSAQERRADHDLVTRLRAGDEEAFATLVGQWSGAMLRVAMIHTPTRAVAEEVVQETWLALLQQLDRFQERSSLKTWVFQILAKRSITHGVRERRSVPFSGLAAHELDSDEAAAAAERFLGPEHRWAGHWMTPPRSWAGLPEERLVARETRERLEAAVEALPAVQRTVLRLRDVDGWTGPEVCQALALSEANQRVLLHRARSKVRRALEGYLDEALVS
jgi:RNA polymerase sigma-70 factor (ECF subfamily)